MNRLSKTVGVGLSTVALLVGCGRIDKKEGVKPPVVSEGGEGVISSSGSALEEGLILSDGDKSASVQQQQESEDKHDKFLTSKELSEIIKEKKVVLVSRDVSISKNNEMVRGSIIQVLEELRGEGLTHIAIDDYDPNLSDEAKKIGIKIINIPSVHAVFKLPDIESVKDEKDTYYAMQAIISEIMFDVLTNGLAKESNDKTKVLILIRGNGQLSRNKFQTTEGINFKPLGYRLSENYGNKSVATLRISQQGKFFERID